MQDRVDLPPARPAEGYRVLPNGQWVRLRHRERGKAARREDKRLRRAQREDNHREVLRILSQRARRRAGDILTRMRWGQVIE